MKTKYVARFGFAIALALLLTGCSKGVKGTYACNGGLFLKSVTLGSDDQALVTGNVFGMTQQKTGTYKVDGDNITITVNGDSTRFALKDKTLDGGPMVGTCTAQ